MTHFSNTFIERVGEEAVEILEQASKGKAPDWIDLYQLAILMGANTIGRLAEQCWADIALLSNRPYLNTGPTQIEHSGIEPVRRVEGVVHRDRVRRLFEVCALTVQDGSAMWCWLNAKRLEDAGKIRPNQRHKRDFQHLCQEHWYQNPHATIGGTSGVAAVIGRSFGHYSRLTLEKWAREAAPAWVKKPGRRRKAGARVEVSFPE